MAIGANGNNNIYLIMFEVGMITRNDDGSEKVQVVGLHPLVVGPSQIAYTDNTRSPTVQTSGGAVKTVSGRGLRDVAIAGSFGVESRGLGIYIGTGETRFQRFYKEVVRLPDALSKDDVDENVDFLRGTPFLKLLLLPYDPDRTVFYINYYDFWQEIRFSAKIKQWNHRRSFNQGGASALTHYQMTVEEEGELVTGSLVTTIINALFNGLAIWNGLNDVLKSYTLGAILDAQVSLGNIVLGQFNETLGAVQGQVDSATGVMGGFAPGFGSGDNLVAFLSSAQLLASQAKTLAGASSATGPGEDFDNDPGAVSWDTQIGEGGNAGMDLADEIDGLEDLADAAAYQVAAGALYGLDRLTFQAFIAGTAESAYGPEIKGSTTYTVGPTDSEQSISDNFGLPWDLILDVNGLTPDEALFTGRVLTIPRRKGRGTQPIDGLPVFGSHVGKDAWGRDLRADLGASQGDYVVLVEQDVLVQGVDWLVQVASDPLIQLLNMAPPIIRDQLLRIQLQQVLLTDKRIAGIEDIQATLEGESFDIQVTFTAINGSTVQTGAPRT